MYRKRPMVIAICRTGPLNAAALGRWLLVAVLLCVAIGDTRAGNPGTGGAERPPALQLPSTGHTTVRWMGHWLHNDLRDSLFREVAREFAFLHPELNLHVRFPPEIMGHRSKVTTARYIADCIRGDSLRWDILWMDDHIYSNVADELGDNEWARKHLVDFEQVPGFVEAHKPFIVSDPTYRHQTGGILVGPYVEGYYLALWYNDSIATRLGIAVKQRGMTFDDLLGYAAAVHAHNNAKGDSVALFYESVDWFTLEMLFQSLVKSHIGDYGEATRADAYTPRKRDALRAGLECFEALGRYRPLIESHDRNRWVDTRHLVLNDEALFYCHGTWMYNLWREIDKQRMTRMVPAELPVLRPVDFALGGYIPSFAVNRHSPVREQAIDVLMWWCRPEVAEKWVSYTKNPTGLRGNVVTSTLGDDVYGRFQSYMTTRYRGRVHYTADAGYLLGAANASLFSELNGLLRLLLMGRIDAESAFQAIELRMRR
ncbi:MAG: extracellular solute-binding protein [Chitinivibrionales bacterium]|nr:extracellular solute-binding protein [Chitinivibrionales bacterium]